MQKRVPFPDLDAAAKAELARQAERFVGANRVSILVGAVLGPVLFFGVGGFFWWRIPAPFGAWVGGSIVCAGVVFLLFLAGYALITMRRRPYLAWATVDGWHEIPGRYGQRSHVVAFSIDEARELARGAVGAPVARHAGQSVRRVLVSTTLFHAVSVGQRALFACMATGEVFAIHTGARLVVAS